MVEPTTSRNRVPALRRLGVALAFGPLLLAARAWWQALGRGGGQADVVGAAYALLITALGLGLLATWPAVAHRGTRAAAAWVAAATLAWPVGAWLALRSAAPRHRYEVAISSGLYEAPDGTFRWSITLAEPFTAGRHALLQLERDGHVATLPLALRRSPRDNVAAGAWGLALRPLGADRYWLAVGTAWARSGPQYFLLEWPATGPSVREIARGLRIADGHARWDCEAWGEPAREAPDPGAFCRLDGTLPPVRACQLERLAADCGPGLAPAAGCQPELAGELPVVVDCLERRAREGDPLAWDGLVLATAVARDGRALYDLLARSLADESARDPDCGPLRHGARQLAAGRQLGRWWEWVRLDGATTLLAARRAAGAAGSNCAALPPVAAALALDSPALEWEAAWSAREAGRVDDSCARVLALAGRGELERLAPPEREAARAWYATCAARRDATPASAP